MKIVRVSRSRRWSAVVCLLVFGAGLLLSGQTAYAQEGQGKYIIQATARMMKLVDKANAEGFVLANDAFSLGGGWLKQSTDNWVPLYNINLQQGRRYRFLGAGDNDARDVDLRVLDSNGKVVATDEATASEASVDFTPQQTQKYTVQIRLYASDQNLPCMCVGAVLEK